VIVGVRRFRSVDEMPDHPPPARTPLDGLRSACELSAISTIFGRSVTAPRGVRRFRSVAEAAEDRRAREDAALGRVSRKGDSPGGSRPASEVHP